MGKSRIDIVVSVDYKGKGDIKAAARDIDDLGKAGKRAEPGLDGVTKKTDSFSSTLKSLATAGAVTLVAKQLLDFGKASIIAASDVEEMQSKFNTVFKSLSSDVTAELQEFADAANRSIFDLQGFAATLQDTFVPLGFARDQAADMSVEVVQLAEDLASFNNLPTQQVVEDLQSALVGNTETLRKYGVVANQAAIDQKALELGLEFTKGQMDAQTKAAAILAITLESTTDAQGDAIKTAESYANVSKGLEAALLDLKVTIGNDLLPAATSFKQELIEIVNINVDAIKAQQDFRAATEDGGKSLLTNADALAAYNDKLAEMEGRYPGVNSNLTAHEHALRAAHEAMKAAGGSVDDITDKQTKFRSGLELTNAEMGAWAARMAMATDATERWEERVAIAARVSELQDDVLRNVNRTLLEHGANLGMTSREAEELAFATGELPGHQEDLARALEQSNERLETQAEVTRRNADAFNALGSQIDAVRGPIGELIAAQEELAGASGAAAEEAQGRILAANEAISESYRQTALDILKANLAEAYGEDALGAQLAAIQQAEALGLISQAQAELEADVAVKADKVREVTSTMFDEFLADGILTREESEAVANAIGLIESGAVSSGEAIQILAENGVGAFGELSEKSGELTDGIGQVEDAAKLASDAIENIKTDVTVTIKTDLSGFRIPNVGDTEVTIPITTPGRLGGETMAHGGFITGGVAGRDSVPIMAMPGEYVIRKSAVDRVGLAFMNALNSGTLQGMAHGGPVTNTNMSNNFNFYGFGDTGRSGIEAAVRRGQRETLRQAGLSRYV